MRIKSLLTLIILTAVNLGLSFQQAQAQTFEIGDTLSKNILSVFPLLQYSNHSAGFTDFGGCTTCASADGVKFNNTSGINFGLGIAYEQRFTKKFLLQFRAFFVQNTVDF